MSVLNFFKSKIKVITNVNDNTLNNMYDDQYSKSLYLNLKQLEFISNFEMHLDNKAVDSYSLSFLQELSKIKQSAKLNTIQSIRFYKKQK
ncbi:hypothetical protein [Olleya marilimosa]|uniref:Uncharacterized protein n=1 Tax=Olleya marilimosa TaxID=272164 RepID=A0ABR8M0Q0_9FLAO|nr:hypothetical protein [Olleya marilimosa]MBD3864098.1 hypothetical protein [Olleya marilimosa]MBD3891560.1 hypothetical protein [Olleya marilimosa]